MKKRIGVVALLCLLCAIFLTGPVYGGGIEGYVFSDNESLNSTMDFEENGISDITIKLGIYDFVEGHYVQVGVDVLTDLDGFFSFTGLDFGLYGVKAYSDDLFTTPRLYFFWLLPDETKQFDFGIYRETEEPTAILLADFDALPGNGMVMLVWETGDEMDNLGFNIYRAESEDGEYVKINTSLIAAKNTAGLGSSYELVDSDVENLTNYYYKLEDVDIYGEKTLHGPVKATPMRMFGIF